MDDILKTFDLNSTDVLMIAFCAVLFVCLWRLLDRILFTPYLKFLDSREAATTGARHSAQDLIGQAGEVVDKYNVELTEARVAAMKEKLLRLNNAKKEAQSVIDEAETEAKRVIEKSRAELNQRTHLLREKSLGEVQVMADMIVDKIKRPVGGLDRIN